MDPQTQYVVGMIAIALLSLAWHEAAHAWVADKLGDPTARQLGRVTLNPLRHLDPFLSLILPWIMFMTTGVIFGGGKPVPINPAFFRHRARDFMLVALAGPFSNLLLAALFCLVYAGIAWVGGFQGPEIVDPYGRTSVAYEPSMLRGVISLLQNNGRLPSGSSLTEGWLVIGFGLNVLLAIFNLTPIPPLDGSRVIGWLLPRAFQGGWYRLDRYGLILVVGLLLLLDGVKLVFLAALAVAALYAGATDFLVALDPLA